MINQVPRVGLGCMGMSEFYGERDDANSLATLQAAFEMGYRHFDTADMYGAGHNEELLGKFLAQLGAAREDVLLATKVGIRREGGMSMRVDGSPEYLREACDASLRRLGVERIGLYYLHRRNPDVPIAESMQALAELQAEGKIAAIGLSEVSAHTLREAAQVAPVAALQSEYSLWTRDPEAEVLAACAELGVAFVAYSPVGRGFLTGGIQLEHLGANDLRTKLPRFQPGAIETNARLVDAIKRMAAELEVLPAQLALAWVLAQRPWMHVIPGTRNAKHLLDNFRSRDIALSAEQAAELGRVFAPDAVAGMRYPEPLLKTVNT